MVARTDRGEVHYTHISMGNPYIHIPLAQIPSPHPPQRFGGGGAVGVGGWGYLSQRYMDIWITHGYVGIINFAAIRTGNQNP